MLIGRSLSADNILKLNLGAGAVSISVKGKIFFGPVTFLEHWQDSEFIDSVVENDEIDSKIRHMDLSSFCTNKEIREELRSILWEKRNILKVLERLRIYPTK